MRRAVAVIPSSFVPNGWMIYKSTENEEKKENQIPIERNGLRVFVGKGTDMDLVTRVCRILAYQSMYKKLTKQKGSHAEKGLSYVNALFDYKRKIKNYSPEQRYQERQEYSKPIAEAFFSWVETLDVLPKSPLGEAVCYALFQRKYLEHVFWMDV
ncbi:MAG: IS66 family transposase [Lachnoclostridium sp.]|jgi:hypothetical protein|nr:IS66 family transposase [Lachnoclostridium sp.]